MDATIVDACIKSFKAKNVDYFSNINPPTYPDGLDVEVMSFSALKEAQKEALTDFDREHVTPYLRNNKKFNKSNLSNDKDCSNLRWTVDELNDLKVISNIFEHFSPDILFDWQDVLKLQDKTPNLFSDNKNLSRNEGAKMSTGQKLWKRAKQIIPGGNARDGVLIY